jgi:hypothetical protein
MFGKRYFGNANFGPRYWGNGSVAQIEVPDVVGDDEAPGTLELEGAGFAVSVLTEYSSLVAVGVIISQSPAGGEFALPGSTVTITVSLGEAPADLGGGYNPGLGGGGTGIDYQVPRRSHRKLGKEIEALVESTSAELAYKKLLATAPKAVKAAAAAAVRPYADAGAKTPPAVAVDWQALERDAAATAKVIALWTANKQRIQAEEEWFLLGD